MTTIAEAILYTILNVIIPIFALIALGYAVSRTKLLDEAAGEALARFVFLLAVPALLFRTLSTVRFGDANPFSLWFAYFGAIAVTWCLVSLLVRLLTKTDRRTGVIVGVSASFANTVFVGIPAVERAYGQEGLTVLFLIISIHLPVMMTASTLLIERAARLDAKEAGEKSAGRTPLQTLRQIVKALSSNAIVLGIAAGLLWRLTGAPLPEALDEVVGLLGGTAAPLALIALGMSLTRYGIGGDLKISGLISAFSLLVMPGLVYLIGHAFLPPVWLKAAVIVAACPAGVNAYLFAAYFRVAEKIAATVIVLSTLLSVVTLGFWLAILG